MIFAVEIFNRTEDAAGDQISLDFGKPDFDLVEPGGVGGRALARRHLTNKGRRRHGCAPEADAPAQSSG
jgi:hypothetical protein